MAKVCKAVFPNTNKIKRSFIVKGYLNMMQYQLQVFDTEIFLSDFEAFYA